MGSLRPRRMGLAQIKELSKASSSGSESAIPGWAGWGLEGGEGT